MSDSRRYRVALTTVKGRHWRDFNSRSAAIAEARFQGGDAEVLEERPWPRGTDEWTRRFAANFVRIWP